MFDDRSSGQFFDLQCMSMKNASETGMSRSENRIQNQKSKVKADVLQMQEFHQL